MANASEELVVRRQIVLGSRSGEHILKQFFSMRFAVIRTVPRQIF
jgi:hypothetical protein